MFSIVKDAAWPSVKNILTEIFFIITYLVIVWDFWRELWLGWVGRIYLWWWLVLLSNIFASPPRHRAELYFFIPFESAMALTNGIFMEMTCVSSRWKHLKAGAQLAMFLSSYHGDLQRTRWWNLHLPEFLCKDDAGQCPYMFTHKNIWHE